MKPVRGDEDENTNGWQQDSDLLLRYIFTLTVGFYVAVFFQAFGSLFFILRTSGLSSELWFIPLNFLLTYHIRTTNITKIA